MSTNERAASRTPTLRRWLLAASRLSPDLLKLRHAGQRADLVPSNGAGEARAAPSAAAASIRAGAAEADLRRRFAATDIAAEDWDLLFRAALEVLARVAVEKPAPSAARVQVQAPGTVLRECLAELERLRKSVPLAPRQQSMWQASGAEGRTTRLAAVPPSTLEG